MTGRFSFEQSVHSMSETAPFALTKTPRANRFRGYVTDSLGRALEWHSRGQRFDPAYLHQKDSRQKAAVFFCIERDRKAALGKAPVGPCNRRGFSAEKRSRLSPPKETAIRKDGCFRFYSSDAVRSSQYLRGSIWTLFYVSYYGISSHLLIPTPRPAPSSG